MAASVGVNPARAVAAITTTASKPGAPNLRMLRLLTLRMTRLGSSEQPGQLTTHSLGTLQVSYRPHGRFSSPAWSQAAVRAGQPQSAGSPMVGEAESAAPALSWSRIREVVSVNAIAWVPLILYLVELTIKIVALGTIPGNRRPSSSIAWLLLIVVTPILGLVIFLLIGSPFVRGRRAKVQAEANKVITERTAETPDLPPGADIPVGVDSLFRLNRHLSHLPCVTGVSHGLFGDSDAAIKAMAEAVNEATTRVHSEFFITAWDDTTDVYCTALADAVKRGVKVRLLYDDIASRAYPGFKEMNAKLTAAGIEWHEMMPIKPLKGKWRRPDLRNHRKLLVVDGKIAFMGSQNMIDSSYLLPKNIKVGRHWKDLNIKITGEIVDGA